MSGLVLKNNNKMHKWYLGRRAQVTRATGPKKYLFESPWNSKWETEKFGPAYWPVFS